MAKKQASNLIGFDPLAWVGDESGKQEKDQIPITDNIETTPEKSVSITTDGETKPPESADQDSTLVLEAVQNIQNVNDLHDKLTGLLQQAEKIEIDASAVTSIDTATLQLLAVLKQTAINEQKQVVFDFPSERFIEAAELLDLAQLLELDSAAAGFF